MLVSRRRLTFDRPADDWLNAALVETGVEIVPISSAIALRSTRLATTFHADPSDQIIVATAVVLDVPLITADERIQNFAGVRSIW